jgi:cold shock CspA family protein
MEFEPEIVVRGIEPESAVRDRLLGEAVGLLHFCEWLIDCRVLAERVQRRHHEGNLFHVRIEMGVPGRRIVVGRTPSEHHAFEDLDVAVADAFHAARRRLEDYVRIRRGMTKHHELPAAGHVVRLFPEAGYGFVAGPDGREVYFHRNSVLRDAFDVLDVGTEVKFSSEDGDDGPQATSVHVARVRTQRRRARAAAK